MGDSLQGQLRELKGMLLVGFDLGGHLNRQRLSRLDANLFWISYLKWSIGEADEPAGAAVTLDWTRAGPGETACAPVGVGVAEDALG